MVKYRLGPSFAIASMCLLAVSGGGYWAASSYGFFESDEPITGPITQEIIEDGSDQDTGDIKVEVDGREYKIWEGHVLEDVQASGSNDVNYEGSVFNFDLGEIYHSNRTFDGGIAISRFNDLAVNGELPAHIERVRQIGCDIAQQYEDRSQTRRYGPPPADVSAFKERHCTPAPSGG